MRRSRSHMRRDECIKALEAFASKVKRFLESSDKSSFSGKLCEPGEISVQFLVRGGFGVAEDLFEAIRVLAGHRIAADDRRPRKYKRSQQWVRERN
jgi:hypothetical protein